MLHTKLTKGFSVLLAVEINALVADQAGLPLGIHPGKYLQYGTIP